MTTRALQLIFDIVGPKHSQPAHRLRPYPSHFQTRRKYCAFPHCHRFCEYLGLRHNKHSIRPSYSKWCCFHRHNRPNAEFHHLPIHPYTHTHCMAENCRRRTTYLGLIRAPWQNYAWFSLCCWKHQSSPKHRERMPSGDEYQDLVLCSIPLHRLRHQKPIQTTPRNRLALIKALAKAHRRLPTPPPPPSSI